MRFYLIIPVDLDLENTKRDTIKRAGKNKLLDMSRNPEPTAAYLREKLNSGDFLVRSPSEKTYAEMETEKALKDAG